MTKPAFRHDPIPFRDENGLNCLRIPLDRAGRSYAIATEADYHRLQRSGATGTWFLNDAAPGRTYVRTAIRTECGQTLAMVARLIMEARPRTVIRYVNGDHLDLRPWNLVAQKGKAKRDDMQIVERGQRAMLEAFRQEARA